MIPLTPKICNCCRKARPLVVFPITREGYGDTCEACMPEPPKVDRRKLSRRNRRAARSREIVRRETVAARA